MPEEKNSIPTRVRVLEVKMKDVKDDIKSIRKGQYWLLSVGWLILIGIVAGWIAK